MATQIVAVREAHASKRIERKENIAMTTQTLTRPKADEAEKKIKKLRELYADAPELGRAALERLIGSMKDGIISDTETSSAGRTGLRRGKVSELTIVFPIAPGGAKRLRAVLDGGVNVDAPDRVGTVHDMRYVFLDNDTRILFATTYDGDWDPYVDDFATHIPDELDVVFCNCEGWPGVRSPAVKDYIAKYQVTARAWYVSSPNLTVKDTKRLEKIGPAVEEFLDKVA
jgi:hypothetical protein